MKNLWKRWIN